MSCDRKRRRLGARRFHPGAQHPGEQAAEEAEEARAAHHGERPGAVARLAGFLFQAEPVGTGNEGPEQQLVKDQDHDEHGANGPPERPVIALVVGEGDVGADAGQCDAVSPTVSASDATTKNQPPETDIIMFQMSGGMAKGTSRRQKRTQGLNWKLRAASTISCGMLRSEW